MLTPYDCADLPLLSCDVLDRALSLIGLLAILVMAVTAVVLSLIFVVCWLIVHFPRFHFGAPKASMELCSYGRSQIITGKDGEPRKDEPKLELFQKLDVTRWFGLSSRNRAHWFCGFIVFRKGS